MSQKHSEYLESEAARVTNTAAKAQRAWEVSFFNLPKTLGLCLQKDEHWYIWPAHRQKSPCWTALSQIALALNCLFPGPEGVISRWVREGLTVTVAPVWHTWPIIWPSWHLCFWNDDKRQPADIIMIIIQEHLSESGLLNFSNCCWSNEKNDCLKV